MGEKKGWSPGPNPCGFIGLVSFIGAAVYFIGQAHGFGGIVVAFLKAIIWPGYLIYHLLQFLKV